MTTQTQLRSNTEAERLADALDHMHFCATAAELRRLVSFNKDLMDEVARLQKREWVELTDDQYFEIGQRHCLSSVKCYQIHKEIYEAIEAKLKEKNT